MRNSITKTPRIASIASVIGALAFPGVSALSSQAALLVGNTEGNNILLFDEQISVLGLLAVGVWGIQTKLHR